MCAYSQMDGSQTADERQQRSRIEQQQHRAERRQHGKSADTAGAGVLFALVYAFEGQPHEYRHRDCQAEAAGHNKRCKIIDHAVLSPRR